MQQVHRALLHARARAHGRQVHSRACHQRVPREEFSLLSLLPVLSSRSSARFLPSRSRELVVVPVFRALPHFFFVDQSNRPGWRNVSYLSENEFEILGWKKNRGLFSSRSTDGTNDRRTWFHAYATRNVYISDTREKKNSNVCCRYKKNITKDENVFLRNSAAWRCITRIIR